MPKRLITDMLRLPLSKLHQSDRDRLKQALEDGRQLTVDFMVVLDGISHTLSAEVSRRRLGGVPGGWTLCLKCPVCAADRAELFTDPDAPTDAACRECLGLAYPSNRYEGTCAWNESGAYAALAAREARRLGLEDEGRPRRRDRTLARLRFAVVMALAGAERLDQEAAEAAAKGLRGASVPVRRGAVAERFLGQIGK